MNFRDRYSQSQKIYSCGDVIQSAVANADGTGQVECIAAKVDALTRVVAAMADTLPDYVQRELVEICSYGMEEVE